METTMRFLFAALLLLAGVGTATADIRINESRYASGKVIISGETEPLQTVTLDGKYKTKSDGGGHFKFSVKYKPDTCMSDIRSGSDVYSAVIAGCLDAGDVDGPLPTKQTSAKP
jgi:hypothetical protein